MLLEWRYVLCCMLNFLHTWAHSCMHWVQNPWTLVQQCWVPGLGLCRERTAAPELLSASYSVWAVLHTNRQNYVITAKSERGSNANTHHKENKTASSYICANFNNFQDLERMCGMEWRLLLCLISHVLAQHVQMHVGTGWWFRMNLTANILPQFKLPPPPSGCTISPPACSRTEFERGVQLGIVGMGKCREENMVKEMWLG